MFSFLAKKVSMSTTVVVRYHSVASYRNGQTSYAEDSFRGHAGFFNADICMHRLKIMEKKSSIKLNLTNTVLQLQFSC